MRLRLSPFPGGVARISAAGDEDVRGVSLQFASQVEAWFVGHPVGCRGAARAA